MLGERLALHELRNLLIDVAAGVGRHGIRHAHLLRRQEKVFSGIKTNPRCPVSYRSPLRRPNGDSAEVALVFLGFPLLPQARKSPNGEKKCFLEGIGNGDAKRQAMSRFVTEPISMNRGFLLSPVLFIFVHLTVFHQIYLAFPFWAAQ